MEEAVIGENFYGSVPQDLMRQLNQRLQTTYWKTALEESSGFLQNKKNWFFSEQRSCFLPYLNLHKESIAADIGAGCGALSEALSKAAGSVIAIDKGEENLAFMRTRFSQDKIANIQLIDADALSLPIKNNTCDLAILNGLLEWLPNALPSENPQKIQLRGLKECCRILKNGGQIYIGIENRSFYRYFSGAREGHSGLPWVGILPRPIARIYSRIKTGNPYINYTYTFRGYANLLNRAGFANIDFYWAWPSYNQISWIVPFRKNVLNYHLRSLFITSPRSIKERVKIFICRLLPAELLVNNFIIIARKC